MADRVLRGSRLGSTSYEADRNHDLAPRRTATYRCPRDHEFTVPMADDAEVPAVWDCRMHGLSSTLIDGSVPEAKAVKPPRTHWDMPLQPRSLEALGEILTERLAEVKARRTAS